jgi:integrase
MLPVAAPVAAALPTFAEFAAIWVAENEVAWRRSNRRTVADILNGHLLPAFGDRDVGHITKSDILTFRSTLAKVPGRKAETLSAKRINAILAPLRQILNEAADRFDFTTPYRNIKPLKQVRPDVEPFTLDEVQTILRTVREDYRHYFTVRFFTGMRTGEIDGLKWQYVDFERRQILIRETIVGGEEDTTKTEGSQREIHMSQRVFDALQEQARATRKLSKYVFCTREGQALDHNNVTKRVWYPLLRYLGLKERRPYQTRHTAATLWLASGENPLWIARQLGHSSTEMLFKVYGRFVPNLTRQDGSAFERLLLQASPQATPTLSPAPAPAPSQPNALPVAPPTPNTNALPLGEHYE